MSPQVSARALDVVEDLATRWGEDLGNGVTRIRRSQTTMARDLGCSAGTIAWYLSHAGNTVRRQGNDILVERSATPAAPTAPRRSASDDIASALIEHFGHPSANDLIELLDEHDRPPTTRTMAAALCRHHSTIHAHLTRLEDQGQLTRIGRRIFLGNQGPSPTAGPAGSARHQSRPTQTASNSTTASMDPTVLATLSHAVCLLAEAAHTLTQLAAHSDAPRSVGRQTAEIREPSADTAPEDQEQSVVDVYNKIPGQTPTANCLSTEQPRPRQPAATATRPTSSRRNPTDTDTEGTAGRGLDDETLDNTLAPLLEACDKYRLPAMIDRHGRDALRQQDPAALEAAVAETIRLARTGNLKSPLGFLVSRATEEPTWFDQALRSRRRAASRNRPQPGRDAQEASEKTTETQIAEARWVAQVLNQAQLTHLVTRYRSRHPKRTDPLTAPIAPLITQAARDAVASHPDLDPCTAVTEFTAALFDSRLEDSTIPAAEVELPLNTTGPHLSALLRELDK
jgi:hypothetical protein